MSKPSSQEKRQFRNFEEFWPYYLGEHRQPACRALHYFGTSSGIAWAALTLAAGLHAWFPLAFVFGYGPAWIGHFFIEKNKPASWEHPFWSFRGDFRMLRLAALGRLGNELARLSPVNA